MYDHHDLTWKGDRLFIAGKRAPMAEIVRDARYPTMWRFRLLPDGELSDMVNLTRAKDAASAHLLTVLNRRERRTVEPRIEQTPMLVPETPPDGTRASEAASVWQDFPADAVVVEA